MFRKVMLVSLIPVITAFTQEPQAIVPAAVTMPRIAVDAAKIRAAILLPREKPEMQVVFDNVGGPHIQIEKTAPAREIKRLRKEMTGGAGDAERYERLNSLYYDLDQFDGSNSCGNAAVELRKKQWQAHPDDPRCCREYANALTLIDDYAEAEKVSRKAVELAPDDWSCRSCLGDVLCEKAKYDAMDLMNHYCAVKFTFGSDFSTQCVKFAPESPVHSVEDLYSKIDRDPPSTERLAQITELLEYAGRCHDQAVSLAPSEPAAYKARGASIGNEALVKAPLALLKKDMTSVAQIALANFCLTIPDMIRAAECRPDDPESVLAVATFETMRLGYFLRGLGINNESIQDEHCKRIRRIAEARLEILTRSSDRRTRCRAVAGQGYIAVSRGKWDEAGIAARRAVEIDPDCEMAVALLIGTIDSTAPNFVSLCEKAVQRYDRRLYRTHLAAAYAASGKRAESELEIRKVLNECPDDLLAGTQLAALHLASSDAGEFKKGNYELSEVEKIVMSDQKHPRRLDVAALRAAYCALNGDPTTARVMLESVLSEDGKNRIAKAVLDALPAAPK